jgi:hypothetical protein
MTLDEFARRLCATEHPHLGTVGTYPCGLHLSAATRYWALITPGGTAMLRVILAIRREARVAGDVGLVTEEVAIRD